MKRLVFALWFLFAVPVFGADHAALTCNQVDVDVAVNAAKVDASAVPVLLLPPGNCPSTHINLPKTLVVQGAGVDVTTIGSVNIGNTASRVTALTVTNATGDAFSRLIFAEGQGWRVDHIKCLNVKGVAPNGVNSSNCVWAFGAVVGRHPTGTIDHVDSVNARFLVYGDGLDRRPLGATEVVTLEDVSVAFTIYGNCADLELGARLIVRRFKSSGCWWESHSDQGTRNGYNWEYADGVIDMAGTWIGMFIRGGTGLVTNVTFTGQGTGAHLFGIDNVKLGAWPQRDQIGLGADLGNGLQVLEPAYFWNNKRADGSLLNPVVLNGADALIQQGRDYFLSPKPGYSGAPQPEPIPIPTPAPAPPPTPVLCPLRITVTAWAKDLGSTQGKWNTNGRAVSRAGFLFSPTRFEAVDKLTGCTVTVTK